MKKLIAGPGVFIRNNCITLCKGILDKEMGLETEGAAHAARLQDLQDERPLKTPPPNGVVQLRLPR